MRRNRARWAHAAKVASGATIVVAALAVVVALVINQVIVDRLGHEVDARLAERLASASHGTFDPLILQSGGGHEGDLDDAPVFVWRVTRAGSVTSATAGAPQLPQHRWTSGTTTSSAAGTTFRFDATASGDGWLVAGESIQRVGQSQDDLLLVEGLLGALLLLVTFTGSFVVGLRASAPIEQIRKRQAEFTADASHELRTPLSVIEAEVDLALSRERDAPSYQTTLKRISSESGRLRSIVDDLLWLARADGDLPDSRTEESVDVAAVGDACVERFAAVATAASVTLSCPENSHGAAVIRAGTDSLDRLVSVLLDNACRYAGPGGSVELRVTHAAGRVTLTVDDSGPGIPEGHRELVFDRFHRADDRPGGTGLGLAIADAVVRNTGGSWSIGTSALGGARMEVSWPRATPSHEITTAAAGAE